MFEVSTYLVTDKSKLSRWVAGIQQGFAAYFVLVQELHAHVKELDLLKEFFAARIETLKMSVTDLLNEKEDYSVVFESDKAIKEHLLERVN